MLQQEIEHSQHWLSPEDLAQRLPSFNLRQIRRHMFDRKTNGLDKYVRQIGRRLYIRESDWNKWVDEQVED